MQCFVYKSLNKEDHFLYLPSEFDNEKRVEDIPAALLEMLGELSLVIEFDLNKREKLSNADIEQVRVDIKEKGFYLQMPKKDMYDQEERFFN